VVEKTPFMRGALSDYDEIREQRIEREVLRRLHEDRSFEEALLYWSKQTKLLQTTSGLDTLLEFALSAVDEHETICKDRISEHWLIII